MFSSSLGIGDWGLGIGDWGLGIGDWGLGQYSILRLNNNELILFYKKHLYIYILSKKIKLMGYNNIYIIFLYQVSRYH